MRIGIDIDGVLTNLEQFSIDYFSKYCVENNVDYNINKKSYYLFESFEVDSQVEDLFWDDYIDFYATKENARIFASEVIKKLKEEGHEIFIITARWLTNQEDDAGEQMRNKVKSWLQENEISYDKLIFSKASNERKIQEILDNKIDLMIEDSPTNIMELSQIVPVICFDASYNKDCAGNQIYRCYSWYDIYKKIKEIEVRLVHLKR